jgi:hypothetical protein
MFAAPPSEIRPTWKTATTVEPHEAVSGSTSVACWLAAFEYGSCEISRVTISQSRATRSLASTVTTSRPRLQETVSRFPLTAWMKSFWRVP